MRSYIGGDLSLIRTNRSSDCTIYVTLVQVLGTSLELSQEGNTGMTRCWSKHWAGASCSEFSLRKWASIVRYLSQAWKGNQFVSRV